MEIEKYIENYAKQEGRTIESMVEILINEAVKNRIENEKEENKFDHYIGLNLTTSKKNKWKTKEEIPEGFLAPFAKLDYTFQQARELANKAEYNTVMIQKLIILALYSFSSLK